MNIAVPVSFFHLDRAFGRGRFNVLDDGGLTGSGPVNPDPPPAKPAELASLAAAAAARTTEAKLWPEADDTAGLFKPASVYGGGRVNYNCTKMYLSSSSLISSHCIIHKVGSQGNGLISYFIQGKRRTYSINSSIYSMKKSIHYYFYVRPTDLLTSALSSIHKLHQGQVKTNSSCVSKYYSKYENLERFNLIILHLDLHLQSDASIKVSLFFTSDGSIFVEWMANEI
jgi:hypothetical protein